MQLDRLSAPELVGETIARIERAGTELPTPPPANECHICYEDDVSVELVAADDGIVCPRCGWSR